MAAQGEEGFEVEVAAGIRPRLRRAATECFRAVYEWLPWGRVPWRVGAMVGAGWLGDTLQTVALEVLSPSIVPYIAERQWVAQQTFDRATNILTMQVRDLTEVLSWVLSFGPKVRILKPDSLRQAVVKAIGEMGALYGEHDVTQAG